MINYQTSYFYQVNSKLTADTGSQDVALVLKPVPNKNKPSPADSVKTLVNDSIPDIKVGFSLRFSLVLIHYKYYKMEHCGNI